MGRYDGEDYPESEYIRREAEKKGISPAQACPSDHRGIRGRACDKCGTYFRGDDNG